MRAIAIDGPCDVPKTKAEARSALGRALNVRAVMRSIRSASPLILRRQRAAPPRADPRQDAQTHPPSVRRDGSCGAGAVAVEAVPRIPTPPPSQRAARNAWATFVKIVVVALEEHEITCLECGPLDLDIETLMAASARAHDLATRRPGLRVAARPSSPPPGSPSLSSRTSATTPLGVLLREASLSPRSGDADDGESDGLFVYHEHDLGGFYPIDSPDALIAAQRRWCERVLAQPRAHRRCMRFRVVGQGRDDGGDGDERHDPTETGAVHRNDPTSASSPPSGPPSSCDHHDTADGGGRGSRR
jgi:hypothetical protein